MTKIFNILINSRVKIYSTLKTTAFDYDTKLEKLILNNYNRFDKDVNKNIFSIKGTHQTLRKQKKTKTKTKLQSKI